MSRVLAKRALIPHPDLPRPPVDVGAKVTRIGTDVLKIEYVVIGRIADLRLPPPTIPRQADELWRHSCFEAFVGSGEGRDYVEFNFSPSREWAIYRFEGYRDGKQEALDLPAPDIFVESDGRVRFALTAFVDLSGVAPGRPASLGLATILEDGAGGLSYWALAHPPGDPDFHHRDCFALELPPAASA
jgi:hypothetical protein